MNWLIRMYLSIFSTKFLFQNKISSTRNVSELLSRSPIDTTVNNAYEKRNLGSSTNPNAWNQDKALFIQPFYSLIFIKLILDNIRLPFTCKQAKRKKNDSKMCLQLQIATSNRNNRFNLVNCLELIFYKISCATHSGSFQILHFFIWFNSKTKKKDRIWRNFQFRETDVLQ